MNDVLVQSNRALVIACDGCGRDVHPRFESTPKGFRQVAAMCPCGFLNVDPLIIDDGESAKDAAGENVEAAAA